MRLVSLLFVAVPFLTGPMHAAAPVLVTTIPLGSTAVTGVAANSTTNRAYVINEANSTAVVLDGTTNAITSTVPFSISGAPLYIAVNKAKNQYVIVGGNTGM